MKLVKGLATGLAIAVVTGCASKQAVDIEEPRTNLPGWVLNPIIENGIADTQCVTTTADFNVLKNKATALARAEIAKQINVNVKAMDKTYQRLTDTATGSSQGSDFESVSRQLAKQSISGSRVTQVDYIEFPDDSQKLCVMLTLAPELTKDLFKGIIEESGREISATDEAVLYERFLAKKATEEMEAEFEKYKNQ